MSVEPNKFATIRNKCKYRIQSVDFGTFLERRDTSMVLRPLKVTSKNQEVSNLGRIITSILP